MGMNMEEGYLVEKPLEDINMEDSLRAFYLAEKILWCLLLSWAFFGDFWALNILFSLFKFCLKDDLSEVMSSNISGFWEASLPRELRLLLGLNILVGLRLYYEVRIWAL